jgi:uncharacterized protein YhfF/uncharacterized cupin superfamily protein
MPRPPFLVDPLSVPETDTPYPESDERLSCGRPIGRAAGLQRIGLHVERVPPGRRTSYPHAESDEEEFVYVLDGEIDAWIDGALYRMKKGDLAGFPAGTGICHAFLNNGAVDALLLVGGERTKPTNRYFYPVNPERRPHVPAADWWDDIPLGPQGDHDGRAGNRLGRAAKAWADALRADGVDLGDPTRLTSWPFGDSAAMAHELADLVVAGTKRATASLVWGLDHDRLPLPAAGDRSIVVEWNGTPRCLIETTRVDVIAFCDVDASFAAEEGEGDGSLAYWRREHAAFFDRECAAIGRTPTETMPIACERFRLVRVADASPA